MIVDEIMYCKKSPAILQIEQGGQFSTLCVSRSHALRGNACPDAPRPRSHALRGNACPDAPRPRSHALRGNACPDAPRPRSHALRGNACGDALRRVLRLVSLKSKMQGVPNHEISDII
jgi:hypothetical protein